MDDRMRLAVLGVSGRMGRMLVRAVEEMPGVVLSGATERAGHDWIGQDLGEAMGGATLGLTVSDDPLEVFAVAGGVLDFTTPASSLAHAALAAQARAVHVIGTTGFTAEEVARLEPATRHACVIRAGNMSLGVNLLTDLTRQVAMALDAEYDIEVVEMHHRHKVDAPSGTALMLAEAAAEGRGVVLSDVAARGRDGLTGARPAGEIGMASLRGGDVAGEHDVIFATEGERLVLRHIATDRMIFSRGAVRAALWGRNRPPGHYSMRDVLGLDRGGLPGLPPPVAAYIDAYNARDVPRLMATLSEDVVFQNISGGVLTAEATDKAGFEALAIQGASMFASRRQTVLSAITVGRTTHLEIGFEGVLAEGGETISLKGASAFDIIDGQITRVVDES